MTILKDGEKFACKQCIQGHRVSTCHHSERPLLHVARKGRPVSQCVHCRGLRKARQSHVKCDCGERRHSRTTSSESNTIYGSDDNSCQCGPGRKCICGLRKDSDTLLPASSYADASTPPLGRRSQSAMPRPHSTYLPSMLGPHDFGGRYSSPAAASRRSYHHAQRSADSIPLILESSPAFDVPAARTSSQYLAPSPAAPPQRSQSLQLLSVNDEIRHFNVPLDQDVLARTLSPQNPKRYSMNDWSMMTFNVNDMATPQPVAMAHDSPSYSIPSTDAQWHDGWHSNVAGTPPMHALPTLNEPGFSLHHGLSSSSTVTMSDFGEPSWQSHSSVHTAAHERRTSFASSMAATPAINVDQSSYQTSLAYQDKTPMSWASSSYQDQASDFILPAPGMISQYAMDLQPMDNFSDSPNYADGSSFVFPANGASGAATQQHEPMQLGTAQHHGLPDRSIPSWSTSPPDTSMNAAFKFPSDDVYLSQSSPAQAEDKDWLVDDTQYLELIDSNSPTGL